MYAYSGVCEIVKTLFQGVIKNCPKKLHHLIYSRWSVSWAIISFFMSKSSCFVIKFTLLLAKTLKCFLNLLFLSPKLRKFAFSNKLSKYLSATFLKVMALILAFLRSESGCSPKVIWFISSFRLLLQWLLRDAPWFSAYGYTLSLVIYVFKHNLIANIAVFKDFGINSIIFFALDSIHLSFPFLKNFDEL